MLPHEDSELWSHSLVRLRAETPIEVKIAAIIIAGEIALRAILCRKVVTKAGDEEKYQASG